MVATTSPTVPSTISDRKRLANQRNAGKSTGPLSDAGKTVSSQNARKHGLFCQDLVLPHEDAGAFEWLRNDILRTLNPANAMQLQLVEQIIANEWRIKRVRENEARLAAARNEDDQKQLERYQGYELRLRGSVFRCLRELRQMRSEEGSGQTSLTCSVLQQQAENVEVRNEPTDFASVAEKSSCDAAFQMDIGRASSRNRSPALAMAVRKTVQDLSPPDMHRKSD